MKEITRLERFLTERWGVRFSAKRLAKDMGRPVPSIRRDLVALLRQGKVDRRQEGDSFMYYAPRGE